MPSAEPVEPAAPAVAGPSSGWAWLRSQGLGICCGLATVVLLTVVLTA